MKNIMKVHPSELTITNKDLKMLEKAKKTLLSHPKINIIDDDEEGFTIELNN